VWVGGFFEASKEKLGGGKRGKKRVSVIFFKVLQQIDGDTEWYRGEEKGIGGVVLNSTKCIGKERFSLEPEKKRGGPWGGQKTTPEKFRRILVTKEVGKWVHHKKGRDKN